uniref:DUF4219 domain-containing protein n=1 Tax=Anopheles funestus TaxID=62324 RepID=A0A182R3C7_ANOFN
MNTMQEESKIYLFDGMNFANWSFRMEVHLEESGLLPCIQMKPEEVEEFREIDSDSAEVKQVKAKGLAEWKKSDVRSKAVLIKNIADSQLEYVKEKRNCWHSNTTKPVRKMSIYCCLVNLFGS